MQQRWKMDFHQTHYSRHSICRSPRHGLKNWPENYGKKFYGPTTLRKDSTREI